MAEQTDDKLPARLSQATEPKEPNINTNVWDFDLSGDAKQKLLKQETQDYD